jgi:mono/diheme cytochrome c family protein
MIHSLNFRLHSEMPTSLCTSLYAAFDFAVGWRVRSRIAAVLGLESARAVMSGFMLERFMVASLTFRVLACIALLQMIAASSPVAAEPPAGIDPRAAAYLDKYCLGCHGAGSMESDFRIDSLSGKVGFENTPQWAEIRERISSGEMPPKEAKVQPTAAESGAVVEWLAARIKEGESARMAARDRVSYNRLTRDEYVNTVEDLIGVHFDATDPGGFPDDPEWHGFERIGSVLTLSPSNIEKYLAAAEVILAEGYPPQKPKFFETTRRAVTPEQIDEPHRTRLQELGLLDKVRYEMWAGDIFRASAWETLPEAGVYEISYTLSGLKPEKGRTPRLLVYEKSLDRVLFEQDILAPEDQPITVTFRAHLPKGRPSIDAINNVPGLSNNFRSGRHGNKPFISTKDGRIPWQMKLTDEQGRPRYPFLILDSVSWKGPFLTDEQQRRRDDYWPAEEGNLDEVRLSLGRLASRAFRRPVNSDELDRYVGLVRADLAAGEKFATAVKTAMLAILSSKSFLLITEGDEESTRGTLNDWEIATRLSYLLWSTMPDDELSALAGQGKLKDKGELSRQFRRMLADPRAERFSRSFASQWLNLRKVGMFAPDKKLYPDYDKALEASMIGETTAFFREVLQNGLTLREFLHSDWTMLNGRLADFYGISPAALAAGPDPDGSGFQRVSLRPEDHRGGLLTQAAILSQTSDGTRHRPVHRGKWVSEAIFGKSPPPPPANVEPIVPNPIDSPKATLRMKLEAHIHDARCASCHSKIDPLGLAFENYDAIGRWRTEEVVEGTGENPPVNPAGRLPDGRTYETAEEFRTLLLADIDTFAATFTEKLATYALRRSMSFEDGADLEAIARASREKDYSLRDTLEAMVLSDLFQKR